MRFGNYKFLSPILYILVFILFIQCNPLSQNKKYTTTKDANLYDVYFDPGIKDIINQTNP